MFQVRIVTVDYYMSSPIPELDVSYSDFRKSSIRQVPVIRIFGTTPKGDKTCVHVHGVFPYICIPYDGSESHLKLSYQIAASLDKAINIASGYSTSNTQHVYKVVLVSGIPFYGYHRKRHQFLKIYFYKPSVIKQAVNLLQNGAILNKVFQPHEAHTPFILQFFIDFNLYGMSFIAFESVKFRRTNHPDLLSKIPLEHILPNTIPAVSLSQFEVDASACHISNRPSSQGNGEICNPGIAAIWEDENRRRAMHKGAPIDVPQLHSQRPSQKPTSSEMFYLDRIHHLLDNPSQSGDESSLSGEPAALSNKSYAIEEPPHTLALDASFVSMHVSERHPDAQVSSEDAMFEDTIVDEDVALMNTSISISQRLSQTLDKSLALDYDDLELLDALETLADSRAAVVDDNSVLGSQNSKNKCAPFLSDDEMNSEGEDEEWNDKTLVAEEDEVMKLFDLTMPDIDENAILNDYTQNDPQPGPSRACRGDLQIPQIDGAITLKPHKTRKKLRIPQVDGLNDIPVKPVRKSLGIRVGMKHQLIEGPPKDHSKDERYVSGTSDLIFKVKPKASSAGSSSKTSVAQIAQQSEGADNPSRPSSQNSSELNGPLTSTSSEQCYNVSTLHAEKGLKHTDFSKMSSPANFECSVLEVQMETQAEESCFFPSQSTIENTTQETEPLICLLPSLADEAARPCSALAEQSSSKELLCYCSEDMPLQDMEEVMNLHPPVACCTSTVDCIDDCEENFNCTDAFIDMLANKKSEAVLRGDPCLYPEAPPGKEEFFPELMSGGAPDCYDRECSTLKNTENEFTNKQSCRTSVRKSTRLASFERMSRTECVVDKAPESHLGQLPLILPEEVAELEDPAANLSPCSCGEISITGIPGFTTTMFNDIRDTLGDWSSTNNDASCSDSEMCRLRGALESGQMEEILQTSSNVLVAEPSTSRRDELMLFLESQKSKSDCQGTCSKAKRKNGNAFDDPVTDELLRRGCKAKAGPPPSYGKNMALAKLFCSTPLQQVTDGRNAGLVSKREVKRALRLERRLKLSVSAQKKKKTSEPSLKPCFVRLEQLTKKNIYYICRKFHVKLEDKSIFGIKSRSRSRSTLPEQVLSVSQTLHSPALDERSNTEAPEQVPLTSRNSASPLDITKSSVLCSGKPRRSYLKKRQDLINSQSSLKEEISEVKDDAKVDNEDSLKPLKPLVLHVAKRVKAQADRKKKCVIDSSPTPKNDKREDEINEPLKLVNAVWEKQISSKSDLERLAITKASCSNSTIMPWSHAETNLSLHQNYILAKNGETSQSDTFDNFAFALSQNDEVPVKGIQHSFSYQGTVTPATCNSNQNAPVEDVEKMNMTSLRNEAPNNKFSGSFGSVSNDSSVCLKGAPESRKTTSKSVSVENIDLSYKPKRTKKAKPEKLILSNHLQTDKKSGEVMLNLSGQKNHKASYSCNQKKQGMSQKQNSAGRSTLLLKTSAEPRNVANVMSSSEHLKRETVTYKPEKISSGRVKIKKEKVKASADILAHIESSSLKKCRKSSTNSHQKKISPHVSKHTEVKEKTCSTSARRQNKRASSVNSREEGRKYNPKGISLSRQQERLSDHTHGLHLVALGKCGVKNSTTSKPSMSHKNVPSSSREISNSSSKKGLDFLKSTFDTQGAGIPLTYKIPKKSENDLKECSWSKDPLNLYLDSSDIHLNLSSDSSDETTTEHAKTKTQPKATAQQLSEGVCVDKTSGQSLCVDVVSNKSGSDSFGRLGIDFEASASQQLFKRKLSESPEQSSSKLEKREDDAEKCQRTAHNAARSDIPKSVAHWFDQPFGPWSSWLRNSSSKAHHHAHIFSPSEAVSPEKYPDMSFGGYAAVSHGCMEEVRASDSTIDNSPSNLSPDVLLCSPSKETASNYMGHGKSSVERNAGIEQSSSDGYDSSGKTSHSILDMFSDKSFNSLEVNSSNEKRQCIEDVTPICFNVNPSSFGSPDSQKTYSDEPEGIHSMSQATHQSTIANEEQSNLDDQLDSKLSHESSEIPCGQYLVKKTSQERTKKRLVFSPAFKTLHKPPSKREVLDSLPLLNLPQVVNQEPYFSNYFDVKRKIDVGGNVLDLTSKSCFHLEEFRSNIPGLCGLSHQQKKLFGCLWGLSQIKGDFNQLVSCQLKERMTVISPIKQPPRVRDVALWAKAKAQRRLALQERNFTGREEMPQPECVEPDMDRDLESRSVMNGSSHLFPTKLSQTVKTIQASTPEGSAKKLRRTKVTSPLLTPILLAKSQLKLRVTSNKSKKYSKNLPFQSPLPIVTEKDEGDMGVGLLEDETWRGVLSNEQSNISHEDSSSRCLDTQFCKEAASPLFRHDLDASACQVKGSNSSPGFKMVFENLQNVKTIKEHQYISLLSVEVHVCTCGNLNPEPERDPIRAIFYSVWNDVPEDHCIPSSINGIIAVNCNSITPLLNRCGIESEVKYTNDEKSLLQALVSLVQKWDPDIFAGFETEMLSWGYMLQRASVLGVNLAQNLSRIPNEKDGKQLEDFEDNNGLSGLKITGRICLDVWRLFRSEVALQSYTFENLMYHILHQRVCYHSFESLSRWWENPSHLYRWITVQYYQQRSHGVVRLLEQLDIIGRTSELARLFGIQFFEVLSRGSQFRVESMMLRLAKPSNYIPISPSVQQRAHMRAPECIPLIMEPESRFYTDPMIVLDFQSLYPSMIIAYNYCFSTCLGRVEHLGKSTHFEFGCSELRIKNSYLQQLKDNISVSPSGTAFVTKAVRQGILPRMLEEILEARLAVKQSMKIHKNDHTLQRVLHARQLGLKLIANVTYGYTSANFSGRMPCIEIGDSVVSKGRETLERAINMVHTNREWQARVVYGDTDSLFVLVPGRSREEAFRIGAEIATAVTQDNPSPVKLKLEKVYQPSILQTKKRYVGFMYENPGQKQPVYEAKGIETVRRDGCPAVAKILEKSLKILFETSNVSSVKNYVSHQFSKLLAGRANIQDLIFAREYRGKENYRTGACVPALELTKRWLRHDRRAEPRIGERVPYVIVNGPPGSALIHLVRHPNELLSDSSFRYNAVYYVSRAIIPPLARCFSLLGADVLSWYADLPRKSCLSLPVITQAGSKKTISQYFTTMECACCGALTHGGVCSKCKSNPQLLVASLMSKHYSLESTHSSITKICQSCLGRFGPLDCCSLDCPITYRRHQASLKLEQVAFISQLFTDCGLSPNI